MESTLHKQLKLQLADHSTPQLEIRDGAFRADAIGPGGVWVEIQAGPLGLLRRKLKSLLPSRPVHVVKPIILEKWIIRRNGPGAPDLLPRCSPRKGAFIEIFDELVHLMTVFPDPNLSIELIGVAVDEIRLPRRRRPGFYVQDRRLREVRTRLLVRDGRQLWSLIPDTAGRLRSPFTTRELDACIGRGEALAQRVAYCLRHSGAVEECGFRSRRRLYRRVNADWTTPLEPAAVEPCSPHRHLAGASIAGSP